MTIAPPPQSPPPPGYTSAPPTTRNRFRRLALAALQLVLGAGAIVGLAALLLRPAATPTPPGWRIIRPPHETSALVLVDGTLWAGGAAGLTLVDTITNQPAALPAGEPGLRYVRGLAASAAGALWIAHGRGVTRFDRTTGEWLTFGSADGLFDGAAFAVLVDCQGAVWAGGERGLARYADGRWRTLGADEWPALDAVSALYEDRAGDFWVGSESPTRGGLARLAAGEWRTYGTSDGLAHPSVNAIREDASGSLWVATGFADLGGASRLRDGKWTTLTRADGLAGGKVRSLYFEPSGRNWFGSEYDGIAVFDGGAGRVLTPRDGLSGWEVKAMLRDASGGYWLGTEDGLTRIDGDAIDGVVDAGSGGGG